MAFQEHLKQHPMFLDTNARIPCVYCHYGNILEHVLIHIDARHGKCGYLCSLCFYRGFTKTHVEYHMMKSHESNNDGVVVKVALNPQAQNVKVPLVLPTLKALFKDSLLVCPEKGKFYV